MTGQAVKPGLVGAHPQPNFVCLLFQIESHLAKNHDSIRDQVEIISAVAVFGREMRSSVERHHVSQAR